MKQYISTESVEISLSKFIKFAKIHSVYGRTLHTTSEPKLDFKNSHNLQIQRYGELYQTSVYIQKEKTSGIKALINEITKSKNSSSGMSTTNF